MTERQKQGIVKRLTKLWKKPGGLTPEAVVEDAMNPKSELRAAFPEKSWDDTWAAHQHRLYIARAIMARFSLDIVKRTRGYACPVFVRDPDLPGNRQGYVPVATVKTDRDKARGLLHVEFERAMSLLRRSAAIADEIGLMDEFVELLRDADVIKEHMGLVAA